MNRNEFLLSIQKEPIINSHSHHLRDRDQHTLSLEAVLRNSYVNWCGTPIPSQDSKENITNWLDKVRTRSYFVWLEKALMDLYGIEKNSI